MGLRESLKDIEKRKEITFYEWILFIVAIFALSVGFFILLGFNIKKVFFWNIFDVLNIVDFYLNCFFHRIFESVKLIFNFILNKHDFSQLKTALSFVWNNYAINFLPEKLVNQINNIDELNKIARAYFIYFVSFFLLWGYLFSYMFGFWDKFLPKKILKIIYIPINVLLFDINVSKDDLEKLGAANGNFFKNFYNNLFKQKMEFTDGYQRNKYLKYLKNIPAVLSGDGKYYKSFYHIKQCFLNDKEFLDLFLIIEGYIAPNHKPTLFDKYIENLSREDFKNYKSFNLKDEVTLSLDAMKYFIDDETEKYEKLLKLRFTKGRSLMAIYLNKQKNLLIKDAERVTRMLFGINNTQKTLRYSIDEIDELKNKMFKAIQDNNLKEWWELFKERLIDVFIAYFRFILLREIFKRYMNIPAGTIVVKLDDYTFRNIIDNYDMDSFIAIQKNKNDGQSKSFENDIITNLFFLTFWMFNYKYQNNSIYEKIDKIWNNLIDIDMDEEIEELKNNIIKNLRESIKFIKKEGEKNGN